MKVSYENTIDWNRYWITNDENEPMKEGALKMVERISKDFIDQEKIKNMADFGCGPARMLFTLAEKYPQISFTGYDSAASIIDKNRKENHLPNLKFNIDRLPNIKCKEKYDVVTSIATLHYIKDIGSAVSNLWNVTKTKGFLIFNYPNIFTMYSYRNWVELDENDNRKRFELVLNGENLLTLEKIEGILGKKPKNFWKLVGEESKRSNMCVYVKKPENYISHIQSLIY